jgi:predicted DNA-binding transcriptional regulator AlpA
MSTLLRIEDVQQKLGVSRTTLWRLRAAGVLKTVVIGERSLRFVSDDIDAYTTTLRYGVGTVSPALAEGRDIYLAARRAAAA